MEKNKNVPEIRFEGFEDEWSYVSLGELMNEKNILTSDFSKYPIYSLTIEEGITPKTKRYERGFLITKTTDLFKVVHPDEFVTNPMNLRFGALGYNNNDYSVSVSGYYDVFSIDENECSNFWNWYFKTFTAWLKFNKVATGSLLEKRRVKFSNLQELRFKVPTDSKEKLKIGSYLENYSDLTINQKEKYEKLLDLKKSMLYKLFPKEGETTPEIRFDGFNGNWQKKKLGDCFSERAESYPEGELLSVTINQGIKKFSDLDRKNNSNENKSKYKKVYVGDIAYNSMRMWQGASGYSPYEGIVSPAYTVLNPNEGIDSKCFSYLFKRTDIIHMFQIYSKGITSDNWNLKYPDFKELEVYVSPDYNEQKAIGEYFSKLDKLIELNKDKLEKLKNIKSSLLNKMFV